MKQLDGLIQDLVEGTKYDLIEEDLKFCSRSQLFAMISSIEDGGIIGINFTEMENIISNGSEHKWNYIFGVNRSKNCHNPKEVMIRAFYKDVMDTAKDIEGCIIEPLFVFNEVRISKVYFKVVKGSAGKRNEYTEEAIKTEESNEKDNHLVVQVNCVDCPYYYVVGNEEKSGNFESGSFLHCSCPACGGKMELSGL